MTRRRKLPVGRWLRPCPDCNASFVGAELQHEESCPLQAGVEAVCDEDRQYFLDHSGEWTRTRPITRAELETLRHIDPAGAAAEPDHVHVARAPWGCARTFCNGAEFISLALDPEENAS